MPADLSNRAFVLATDLDGTFLGGSARERRALYQWIEAHRETVGLIFVSGRDPHFIQDLCGNNAVPWPEYVIGDVGTTIARVTSAKQITPIEALEADIAARWDGAGDSVRAALQSARGLSLQPTAFRYRVSYDYDPALFDTDATRAIEAMGHDVLISDNRYFDVLPKGVSKGPSLLRLLAYLGIPVTRVLTAGDTLNDLSMLKAGTRAVAVGGAETPLLNALPDLEHIHRATAFGAAGIMEAIARFNLHPSLEKA
ncbi:MAG: HAD-IIB family hydrolase [Pseudomonadota bacterium]